jgi:Ser/Thr protein kinase RdoA (MazF antagonist)
MKAEIREFIKDRYGVEELESIHPVEHHYQRKNNVFCLTIKDKPYVFKIFTSRYKWENELKSQKILTELTFVPQTVDKGKLDVFYYQLMNKIPGTVLSKEWGGMSKHQRLQIVHSVGESLGLIHSCQAFRHYGWWKKDEGFSDIVEYRSFKDSRIFSKIESENLSKNELISIGMEKASILRSQLKNEGSVLTHRDFCQRNLLVNKKEVTGVIDYEHARPDDPVMDICTLFHSNILDEPSHIAEFKRGYCKMRPFPINFEKNEAYYLIITGLYLCSRNRKRVGSMKRGQYLIKKGLRIVEGLPICD